MTSDYVIIGPRPWEAKIFLDLDHGEEIAEIKKGEDQKSFMQEIVVISLPLVLCLRNSQKQGSTISLIVFVPIVHL